MPGTLEDAGVEYAAGRRRVTELVADLDAKEAAAVVPACPEWTVHDVVAHLAGVCTDALAGNLAGVATAPWADAHVAARRDRSMAELLAEWESAAAPLEALASQMPARLSTLWVLDLTAHEQDVRGALGRPGGRDVPGMAAAVEFLVGRGLHAQLQAAGAGPLEVRVQGVSWVVGGDDAEPAEAPAATVTAPSLFELFRALTGRRSAAQIAAYDWTADPAPWLGAFQFGAFTTRATDLEE